VSKPDPLDPKNAKTTRFEISADELEARMQRQQKMRVEPVQRAVAILEAALDIVMKKLGVNVEDDIPLQQEALGIIIVEETRPEMAGLNGFFVNVVRNGDIIPYAWVGAARLNSMGECFCDIQWFQEERMDSIGGERIIH
jgi:hypothetical protein